MRRILGIYRRLPIKHKLRLIIMASVNVALALMCMAVVTYDQVTCRQEMQDNLSLIAEIFGSSSTAALSFDDDRAASELLTGLKAKRAIIAACIYDSQARTFATYRRDGNANDVTPHAPVSERLWYEDQKLKLF